MFIYLDVIFFVTTTTCTAAVTEENLRMTTFIRRNERIKCVREKQRIEQS